MRYRRLLVVAAMAFAVVATPAAARTQANHKTQIYECLSGEPCRYVQAASSLSRVVAKGRYVEQEAYAPVPIQRAARERSYPIATLDSSVIIPNPPCCPSRAFCACGASYRVFGECIRSLWPSEAWFKFPRASPGHMKVAVRTGHVFVIDYMIDARTAMAWDFNSGGHQSRYHARLISGYIIVDPHGMRMASR